MASIRPPEYPFADGPGNIVWSEHVRRIYDVLGVDPLGGHLDLEARLAAITDVLNGLHRVAMTGRYEDLIGAPGGGSAGFPGVVVLEPGETFDDIPPGTPEGALILYEET